jgi:GT2 family glycosyltransferase
LCARLRRLGLLVVVTPHARLLHFESLSRGYALDGPRPSVTVITGKASGRRCATA